MKRVKQEKKFTQAECPLDEHPASKQKKDSCEKKREKKSSHCSTCMHENVSTLAGHRIRRLSARHAAPILRGVAGAVVQSPAGARLQAGDDSTTLSVTPTLLGLSGAQNPGHRGRPPNARNARGPSSSCSRSFDPVRNHPPAPPSPRPGLASRGQQQTAALRHATARSQSYLAQQVPR